MHRFFGLVALPPRALYSASKGAIVSLTRDLAAEWAKHKITVNAICPGWTKTEMTANYFAQEDVSKFLLERIPLGRFAEHRRDEPTWQCSSPRITRATSPDRRFQWMADGPL